MVLIGGVICQGSQQMLLRCVTKTAGIFTCEIAYPTIKSPTNEKRGRAFYYENVLFKCNYLTSLKLNKGGDSARKKMALLCSLC